MKLPNRLLQSKEAKKYLERIPDFKQKKTQEITTIVLTILALSAFGLFAINPTIATILQLRKELADNKFVDQKMTEKINNLNTLQQAYTLLSPDLPILAAAIPEQPETTRLAGQLQQLAQQTNVSVIHLQVNDVTLAGKTEATEKTENARTFDHDATVPFAISVEGAYDNIKDFSEKIIAFERIVTLSSISLIAVSDQEGRWEVGVRGEAYFKKSN